MTELRKKSIKVLDNLEKCFESAIWYINEIKAHDDGVKLCDREQTILYLEYLIHDWKLMNITYHNDELLNWFKILNDELIILKGGKK